MNSKNNNNSNNNIRLNLKQEIIHYFVYGFTKILIIF